MEDTIVNKVAQSGLVSLDLETYQFKGTIAEIDIKDVLFQGLLLREKDFREFIKTHDWEQYRNQAVVLYCSSDAIVPTWAYMLIANKLSGISNHTHFGSVKSFKEKYLLTALNTLNLADFAEKRVVIKGCGDGELSVAAYVEITDLLTPVVKSMMYGEPCSTVPIFKRK
jgi:hypothetical protein